MKELEISTIGKSIKYFMVIFLCLNLTSCYYGLNDDDDPSVIGQNSYKGVLIDLNGNPLKNMTIVLRSNFDQHIAEFITDENGVFEGQGNIYNTGLKVGIKEEGNKYLTEYIFDYTEYPIDETIEFPPLINTPTSSVSIKIMNNSGLDYSVDYQYIIGICQKYFEDNLEVDSLCYEEYHDTINFDSDNSKSFSIGAVRGTTISLTVSNSDNSLTQTITVDEQNQVETIVFE
ncbi:hypothetical protein LB465_14035 [Salegentibacter sp. LM13S]|uniref:hypothetical protein n=1 Tax=Salegentibacter lacus TaxID=2873599 RepID=UPI001CCF2223|nr:hypothetical protein [Salegentibacter lacus]MBZ9631904.1 hypothetical protein [Salegentibacter lacus]